MQGRLQAVVAMVVAALLALVFSPMIVASAAIVALATVRNGAREGLLVALVGLALLAALGVIWLQSSWVLSVPGALLWLPAWGLALLLRQGYTLAHALEAALVGSWLLIGLQYIGLDSPAEFWGDVLQSVWHLHVDDTILPKEQQQSLLDTLAVWLPGAMAASWFLMLAATLFLTLWAAATLAGTHQFAQAFQALRCARVWLIIIPLLLLPGLLPNAEFASLPSQLYLVGSLLFFLQGLSLWHFLAVRFQVQRFWLSGFYVLLFFGIPYSLTIVALAGYLEGWWDFRARLSQQK